MIISDHSELESLLATGCPNSQPFSMDNIGLNLSVSVVAFYHTRTVQVCLNPAIQRFAVLICGSSEFV